MIKYVVVNYKN